MRERGNHPSTSRRARRANARAPRRRTNGAAASSAAAPLPGPWAAPSQPLDAASLLRRIYVDASFHAPRQTSLFESPNLTALSKEVTARAEPAGEAPDREWRDYERAVSRSDGAVRVGATAEDVEKFRDALGRLEQAYHVRSLTLRDEALVALIGLGRGLLRRAYLAALRNPGARLAYDPALDFLVEVGAAAIQVHGAATGGPARMYRGFRDSRGPPVASLGIELLSSGAFPDWGDPGLRDARASGAIGRVGFENVVLAAADSPRAHVLARVLEEGRRVDPLAIPVYLRTMLDLELMRLGQATTPGTFAMLLESYYRGAGFTDHSTNVSEQVQIIYDEENWKAAHALRTEGDPAAEAQEVGAELRRGWFRSAAESPIGRDHPRAARIEFTPAHGEERVRAFFAALHRATRGWPSVHEVLPVLRLGSEDPARASTAAAGWIAGAGYRTLALLAERTRHVPGLAQYFDTAEDATAASAAARALRVRLVDGRTVDLVATVNKAVEAAAGAIASGQGCIKVGLLGLTYEQMKLFVQGVKRALVARFKREENQLLVFIGIVDEVLVTEDGVLTRPDEIAERFVALMRSTKHNLLLLDTMKKGERAPRLVEGGGKAGHLTRAQMAGLVRSAQAARCDLWVAGSYTEEQVYEAAKAPAGERPSLICLGGAERSVGGLRLDPRDAFRATSPNDEDQRRLAAQVEADADVKFLLSRENKLARDAGHVVGELSRRGAKDRAAARRLEELRAEYLKARGAYFDELGRVAERARLPTRNLDRLVLDRERVLAPAAEADRAGLEGLRSAFEELRRGYVEAVTEQLYRLFADTWFPPRGGAAREGRSDGETSA